MYAGAAKTTTLAGAIAGASDTSFTISDATGWPDGSTGNFVVAVDIGQATEEKILCSTRVGTTVYVASRGYEGTTAQAHSSLTNSVAHTYSSTDADEANAHTSASSAVHGVTGSVVGTTDTQTLTNKTLTSPVVNNPTTSGMTADAASTIGGVSGTSLAADRTAWTAYTPTLTNITGGTVVGAYKLIGKTLYLRVHVTAGTYTANTVATYSLPAGLTSIGQIQPLAAKEVASIVGANATVVNTAVSAAAGNSAINNVTGVIEVA